MRTYTDSLDGLVVKETLPVVDNGNFIKEKQ